MNQGGIIESLSPNVSRDKIISYVSITGHPLMLDITNDELLIADTGSLTSYSNYTDHGNFWYCD